MVNRMYNQKVKEYIASSLEENYALIETLAKIPAPSGQEDLRVEFVREWFLKSGASEVIVDEAKNVIVPVNCDNAKEIVVFMAHTDLVFPDLEPLPFYKDEKYMYCPGIGDDTASLVKYVKVTLSLLPVYYANSIGFSVCPVDLPSFFASGTGAAADNIICSASVRFCPSSACSS